MEVETGINGYRIDLNLHFEQNHKKIIIRDKIFNYFREKNPIMYEDSGRGY